MKHTVYVDRGDHYDVVMNYSNSSRHNNLSEAEWISEYAGDAAYAQMRQSTPGSVAGLTDKGVGRWKKDWSGPYVAPSVRLVISGNGGIDFDGVCFVAADGAASHTLTIKKVDQDGNDVVSGGEVVRILPSAPVSVSNSRTFLMGGTVTIQIGPCDKPCDVDIKAVDPAGKIKNGSLRIRFC